MTDWCRNRLRIEGESVYVADLVARCAVPTLALRLSRIVPMPSTVVKGGSEETEWRWEHWGTKSEAIALTCPASRWRLETQRSRPSWVEFNFRTAGAPPKPVVRALAARYPTLTMSLLYFLPDCDVAGCLGAMGGLLAEEEVATRSVLIRDLVEAGLVGGGFRASA